jgi:hypothetical protein
MNGLKIAVVFIAMISHTVSIGLSLVFATQLAAMPDSTINLDAYITVTLVALVSLVLLMSFTIMSIRNYPDADNEI